MATQADHDKRCPAAWDTSVKCNCGAQAAEDEIALRDYFAARASENDVAKHMQSIPDVEKVVNDGNGMKRVTWGRPENIREIAKYRYADAMLAARLPTPQAAGSRLVRMEAPTTSWVKGPGI